MLQLVKKDILFNWKWALLMGLVAILMPVVYFIDHEETRFILWVYIIGNALANSHFVSKSCYLDDSMQARRFLASLPVKKAQIVLAKYFLGLLCTVISIALISLSSYILGLFPSIQGVLIASIYLILYYGVFLGVFFCSNYSNAEKANTSLIMLTVMSIFILDRSGVHLDEMVINPEILLIGLGICILIYLISLSLSVCFASRLQTENKKIT